MTISRATSGAWVENPPGSVFIHVVIGGRSPAFRESDRARALAAARAYPTRISRGLASRRRTLGPCGRPRRALSNREQRDDVTRPTFGWFAARVRPCIRPCVFTLLYFMALGTLRSYTLLEVIGQGGAARVYRAIGPSGELVAAKLLTAEGRAADRSATALFRARGGAVVQSAAPERAAPDRALASTPISARTSSRNC